MLEKVKNTIEKYNMISEGDTVLCCLSGGADSVSLLLCLQKLGCRVVACHLNHCLRGEESDRDQRFCEDLCSRLGVKLTVRREDVAKFCRENSLSCEEGARELRYRFFSQIRADKIATAHTLSDSLETALFNLARGTGIRGLCGIPAVRGNIIRPLIDCTRREIEDFLVGQGQDWVVDSTNLENAFSRNKIRNIVIPVLEELNSAALDNFRSAREQLLRDGFFLERAADELYRTAAVGDGRFRADVLASADPALLDRAVVRIMSEKGTPYSSESVARAAEVVRNGGRESLPGKMYAVCSGGYFRITDFQPGMNKEICIQAKINTAYDFLGRNVRLTISENLQNLNNIHKKFANCIADYDKIKGEIFLRNRRGGDRIKLAGREHTSSVKKLLGANVAEENRDHTVMLADGEGLFYIENIGIAQRVSPDENTRRLLCCEIS